MRRIRRFSTLFALPVLIAAAGAACGSADSAAPAASSDGGEADAGASLEGGPANDAGANDASSPSDASDAAPSDDVPFATKRAACAFKQGAKPSETFGPSIVNLAIPIDTIVIVSQENRSFDEYFSALPAFGQPDVDVPPANVSLLDANNQPHARFHQTQYCFADTHHDWDSMHKDWDVGKNDGFVRVNDPDGARTLGWFNRSDIGFYYDLATTYGVGDAYFSALLGPTGPNRLYLYAATSSGHIANGPGVAPGQPDIFKRLTQASVAFDVYSAATSNGGSSCPGPYSFETSMFCGSIPAGAKTIADYETAAATGKLPPVSWIYPGSDEHPSADMQVGESNVQRVFDALAKSPQWAHAAFILVYDEGGGAYDHAPPPSACSPDAIPPNIPAEGSYAGKFDRYGFRVPLVVASPYAKAHYVSHVVASHTSILRFLELRFGMAALSDRDANADALLDFFDFTSPSFATATIPAPAVVAPPATKGCP